MPNVLDKDQDSKHNPAEKKYGPDGSHDDLGVHPERREAEIDTLKKLQEAESAPEPSHGTKQEKQESGKLPSQASSSDEPGGWNTDLDDRPKKRRFSFSGRQAAAGGGIAGLLLGSTMGFFGFLSGPLQFLHFAQMLQGFHMDDVLDFGDSRTGKLFRYATKGITGSNEQDRNLSAAGNKIATHYEKKLKARGIELEYNNGRLSRMYIDPSTPAGKRFITEVEADVGERLTELEDGRRQIDLASTNDPGNTASAKLRRSLIKRSTKAMGISRISAALGSRMLKVRAGVDFHPLKNAARAADERARLTLQEKKEEYKKRRTDHVRDGTQPDPVRRPGIDSSNGEVTEAERSQVAEFDGKVGEVAAEAQKPNTDFDTRVTNVKNVLGAGVGVTAVVGLTCGLDALGDSAAEVQQANVILPLIRVGMDAAAVASQMMAGQGVNFEELAALSESFYDEATQTSWVMAQSILAEQGKEGGKEIPPTAQPTTDRPGFFGLVDDITGVPGIQETCGFVNSTAGQIALATGGILAAATGPWSAALSAGGEVLQDRIANELAPHLVRWLAGEAVDVANFAGADYGSIANYGLFLAGNNVMQGMGGRVLDIAERFTLDQARHERIKDDMATKSFYSRFFNPTEPHSLFASTVLTSPSIQSTSGTIASMSRYPTNIFSSLSSSFRSIIPGASAQAQPFDYGVPEIGYSLDEINSLDFEDPYANAERVEDPETLTQLNSDYGEPCFGTTIDPSSGKITYTDGPSYFELKDNKDKCTSDEADRYRFYLADMINAKAVICYEGIDEEACNEVGLGNIQSSTTANANLYMVGDSLTAGMKEAGGLDQKLTNKGWKPTTNGLVSRKISGGPSPDGLTQVEQDGATVREAGTVVIALGTNHWSEGEPQFREELQKMYDKVSLVSPDADIWWVNYYGTGRYSEPLKRKTQVVKEFAESTQTKIIDWANEAEPYFTGEDVHPNDYAAMADFVVNTLGVPSVQGGANPGITQYSPALSGSGSITPKGITLHWWGASGNNNIETLATTLRSRGLGVQFGITEDGTTYQMTQNETDQVGHAPGGNSTTFGIEIEGGPEDFGPNGPTNNPAKFNAVVDLVKYLSAKYNIPVTPQEVVCGDVVGVHPHKAYNKCGNTKIDIDDAYFNAVMNKVRGG